MQAGRRSEVLQISLIVLMFAAAAVLWASAPDRMPVHWNIKGEVDRYGSKAEGLLLAPVIALGLFLLLRFLPKIDPHHENYALFAKTYAIIRTAVIVLLTVMHGAALAYAFGYRFDMGRVVSLAVGVLFCVLGNFMAKLRPNWFVGVRTPWTLSSRTSWTKTHRLAGRLFVAMGLILIALGFLQAEWTVYVILGMVGITVAWLVVYSYVAWKNDPDRDCSSASRQT